MVGYTISQWYEMVQISSAFCLHSDCGVWIAGDWLQGPYVYALYADYNMSKHDIEVLFVAGFGSSMIFGTVVGSFADK